MRSWMQVAGRRMAGSALGDTFTVSYQTRIAGLAAEASFWGVFALPWLILGLVAGVSYLERWFDVDAAGRLRAEILSVATEVLTPEAIDDLLVPLVDSIFDKGRASLGLLSVVAAIWAGSRVIDALVDGMTIVYRQEGLRGFVKTRVLSLAVYVGGLLWLTVAIPLVITGPTFLARWVPGVEGVVTSVLLVAAEVGVILVLLASLYHWAVPHRTSWTADLPGALIAMVLWVALSLALRLYFAWLFRAGSVYGAISAPIAIMLWSYVTCLALLLGAAFNGVLAVRRGWAVRSEGPDRPPVGDLGGEPLD